VFFEMVYETNLFGYIAAFAVGLGAGLLCDVWVFRLLRRRDALLEENRRLQAQIDERNQKRVSRVRAGRPWDT
jgi:hypothetical protein